MQDHALCRKLLFDRTRHFSSPFDVIAPDIADRVRKATDHELEEQTRLRKTEDFKEGVKAVFERRLPNFGGH